MKNKRTLILSLILAIIIILAIVHYSNNDTSRSTLSDDMDASIATSTDPSKLVYSNFDSRFSFEYPKEVSLSTRKVTKDGDTLDVITLKSGEIELTIVPNIKTAKAAEDELVVYSGVLFENPKQLQNSKIVVGDFTGFKSVLSATSLRYTAYKKRDDGQYLILRNEITLPEAAQREKAEGIFEAILKSVKVN